MKPVNAVDLVYLLVMGCIGLNQELFLIESFEIKRLFKSCFVVNAEEIVCELVFSTDLGLDKHWELHAGLLSMLMVRGNFLVNCAPVQEFEVKGSSEQILYLLWLGRHKFIELRNELEPILNLETAVKFVDKNDVVFGQEMVKAHSCFGRLGVLWGAWGSLKALHQVHDLLDTNLEVKTTINVDFIITIDRHSHISWAVSKHSLNDWLSQELRL